MVAPRYRSRSMRRVKVKTPGGRVAMHYKKRAPGKSQCSMCGDYLKGVPRGRVSTIAKISKSQMRPERPYGGVLCSGCMRKVILEKASKLVVQDG